MNTREHLHSIIFEAETPKGKFFDIALLVMILLSVLTVMLESVGYLNDQYGKLFFILEWSFTIFFTIEYGLRLYAVKKPLKYATSFFGIIDLLAIIPTYLSILFAGTHYFVVIRSIRLLRIFRILKLANFTREGQFILKSLKASLYKIAVFLLFVLTLVTIFGSVMYLIEGQKNTAFSDIPTSVYWAIVTLTTVGYGDIAPSTNAGKFIAACVMLLGYAIIAVPTGIVTAELIKDKERDTTSHVSNICCPSCSQEGHEDDANYCKFCGEKM